MNIYEVRGVDRETGDEKQSVIHAESEPDALKKASSELSMYVSKLRLVESSPSTPSSQPTRLSYETPPHTTSLREKADSATEATKKIASRVRALAGRRVSAGTIVLGFLGTILIIGSILNFALAANDYAAYERAKGASELGGALSARFAISEATSAATLLGLGSLCVHAALMCRRSFNQD